MIRSVTTLILSCSLFPCTMLAGKGPGGGTPKSICILGTDFESGIPVGWSVGAPVEQQDALGNGLGTFVDAWTTGTSATASANGYFPVPDKPTGNAFAMANDDAAPCNCAMTDVALTSPVIDLSGVQNAAMRFRAFNNGAFGGGDGVVEASADGVSWTTVATIDAQAHVWRSMMADLSAYDGETTVTVRFRWSDNGGWAGGLAVDDVCISARPTHDLVLLETFLSDAQVTAFDGSRRTLDHTQLPLEQADSLVVKAVVFNYGSLAAINATCSVSVTLNGATQGSFTTTVPAIGAGDTDTLIIRTGWLPTAPGQLDVSFAITALSADDEPSDNSGNRSMRLTAAGLDQGNNAMALDDSTVTGSIFNDGEDYAVAVRMEPVQPGSLAYAVGFLPGEGSFANGRLVGKLLDHQFNLLTTSLEHVLTQVEIDDALTKGTMVYLPFVLPHALDGGADVYAVIEHESDSGAVAVALGPAATHGSALLYDGLGVDWDFLLNVPIVRLYLSTPEVGVTELAGRRPSLSITPNPSSEVAVVRIEGVSGTWEWSVLDLRGGLLMQGRGTSDRAEVPVSGLPPGCYVVQAKADSTCFAGRLVVVR